MSKAAEGNRETGMDMYVKTQALRDGYEIRELPLGGRFIVSGPLSGRARSKQEKDEGCSKESGQAYSSESDVDYSPEEGSGSGSGDGKSKVMKNVSGRKGVAIICPGGGYEWLSNRESGFVARRFAEEGWLGIVAETAVGGDAPLGTLPMRQLAEIFNEVKQEYQEDRIIVCGFSAGGHLALSLGVYYKELGAAAPDALVLGYPVVTAGRYAHRGSIVKLSGGDDPDYYSLEKHVTRDVPPIFIWHTAEDGSVPVQNSLLLADALARHSVPFELHIYPYGVHGLSLATKEVEDPAKNRYEDLHVAGWFDALIEWLDYEVLGGAGWKQMPAPDVT